MGLVPTGMMMMMMMMTERMLEMMMMTVMVVMMMMMMIAKLSTSGKHNLMVGGAMPGGEQGGSQVDWQEK